MKSLIVPFLNLSILIGLIFYFVKDKARVAIRERRKVTEKELIDSQQRFKAAKAKIEEIQEKLAGLSGETDVLRQEYLRDLEMQKKRIAAGAESLAAQIRSDAKLLAQEKSADFRKELAAELVGQVIEQAEGLLRAEIGKRGPALVTRTLSKGFQEIRA